MTPSGTQERAALNAESYGPSSSLTGGLPSECCTQPAAERERNHGGLVREDADIRRDYLPSSVARVLTHHWVWQPARVCEQVEDASLRVR